MIAKFTTVFDKQVFLEKCFRTKSIMKKFSISNIITGVILIGALYFMYDYTFNRKPKFIVGEVAPDFEAKKPDNSTLKLSDYRGKIVLLDFWGTWCGPCLSEIPGLTTIYNKYKNTQLGAANGFEIVAVAMDNDKEKWKNTIERRGMNWGGHVSDLKRMKGDVGTLYNVLEIPTKYLLNEKGIIISVNPTVQELDKLLMKKASN
ncbi:MAG: thiol-disulfide isomerase/thioredoxin [Cognaticolwellia sp.]